MVIGGGGVETPGSGGRGGGVEPPGSCDGGEE